MVATTPQRTYERTHPWISFQVDLRHSPQDLWLLLGEARSKCEHIAGVPLQPEAAEALWKVYLAKGAHATTSIEGNTLTEEEVRQRLDGQMTLPRSREYLGTEVDNVVFALRHIDQKVMEREPIPLTRTQIETYNALVLDGLELDGDTAPGRIRSHSVAVANYRGAPPEDCEHLLDRLCEWLNDMDAPDGKEELRFAVTVAKAILAHLYIAWIHPFGDGNGRTARLVEFQILAQSGMVPLPAANLLSDHYNKTRDHYYRVLDRSSRERDVTPFLRYAVEGFVDGLRDQVLYIRDQQLSVAWENYVHTSFSGPETAAKRRRKRLVLDMPAYTTVPRAKLASVSTRVAAEYATTGPRTLPRDVNALLAQGLLVRKSGGLRANREMILAFLPPVAEVFPE